MTGQINVNKIAARTGNTITINSGDKISGDAGSIIAPGNIIQVINGPANAARVSSSSTSYVDSAITATIIPKFATSKILVRYNAIMLNSNNYYIYTRVVRNIDGGSFGVINANEDDMTLDGYTDTASWFMSGHEALDSPNTTGTCIYKVQFRSANSANLAYIGRGTSTDNKNSMNITLMEIAQ